LREDQSAERNGGDQENGEAGDESETFHIFPFMRTGRGVNSSSESRRRGARETERYVRGKFYAPA
jgi:hypothetical protein